MKGVGGGWEVSVCHAIRENRQGSHNQNRMLCANKDNEAKQGATGPAEIWWFAANLWQGFTFSHVRPHVLL